MHRNYYEILFLAIPISMVPNLGAKNSVSVIFHEGGFFRFLQANLQYYIRMSLTSNFSKKIQGQYIGQIISLCIRSLGGRRVLYISLYMTYRSKIAHII